MKGYNPRENRNLSLKLMSKRLGVNYNPNFTLYSSSHQEPNGVIWSHEEFNDRHILSSKSSNIVGVNNNATRLEANGGILQQERMIFDKRRTLDRAVLYSYQAALIKKVKPTGEEGEPVRALINPDKNKLDYDDKIVSVGFEAGFESGDVFDWIGTGTHWMIYLQDIDELAYFRGEIRRCDYTINYEDEDGNQHSTFATVRGPVETKINFIQKHKISIDEPNHSLNIYMPKTKENLEYFKRYAKFYLQGETVGSPTVCWRVEATDWISTPGILEVTAVEYYSNEAEDDVEKGIAGGLIVKPVNSNPNSSIVGESFIKPKMSYTYEYKGPVINSKWTLDKKYPVETEVNGTKVTLKWTSHYSGQMILSYGDHSKTIVIESLF